MAKIYFSEANASKSNDKNAKLLLEKFSANRPEPRAKIKKGVKPTKKAKTKTKSASKPTSKLKLKLTPKARKELQAIREAKLQHRKMSKKQKKEAQKLARVRYLSTLRFADCRPLHMASSSSSHTSTTTTKQKKTKALISTKNSDYHNYAGEYEARNVEFGHGRTRNKEWNDSEALKWQKDIEKLRKQQKEDPNTFDRFAMK